MCMCVILLDLRDYKVSLSRLVFQWMEWNVKGKKYKDFDAFLIRYGSFNSYFVFHHLELPMSAEIL